jgi:phosphonate transport system substrate-binding protein
MAADMNQGDLAAEFVDYDGDLVADLPADKSEWINPDTIIFSYTPVEEPSVYKAVLDMRWKLLLKKIVN